MKYDKNMILLMNSNTLTTSFFHKHVIVCLKNGQALEGYVDEIGLAANINPYTQEKLPVSIKIMDQNINIMDIEFIEEL